MNIEILYNPGRFLVRLNFIIFVFTFQLITTSAIANPLIFGYEHHIGITEIHIYDEIESSVGVEAGRVDERSRVPLVKEVRPDHELIAGVESVAANGVRGSYFAHFSNWKNYADVMKSRGVATEHIGKRVSNARLAARSRYQLQTPFLTRMSIYGRNITPSWVSVRFPIGGQWIKPGGYGNVVGPNWQYFRSKGYSWDQILEGSLRSNSKL